MFLDVDQTIAAIASSPGPALRGIIRISGSGTANLLKSTLALSSEARERLDCASEPVRIESSVNLSPDLHLDLHVLYWPDERSYTRQSSAEIHCLGSPHLLQQLLDLFIHNGCRRAEPGEFTMRAFLSGRLDLAQAEAVMGVIDAKNRRQFDEAFRQLAGGIGGPVTEARDTLLGLLAELEAGLDFVEEDIEFISQDQLGNQLANALRKINTLIEQIDRRRLDATNVTVVLMGRPNVGKSSLFNKLAAGRAMVSDQQGTTRDYIKSSIEFGGRTVELLDTAGLNPNTLTTPIENMMAGKTSSAIELADLRILCLESGLEPDEWEQTVLDESDETLIVAWTKCDLAYDPAIAPDAGIQTSAIRAMGIPELKEEIARRVCNLSSDGDHQPISAARTSASLIQAAKSLQIAQTAANSGASEELIAAEVRTALDHLGRVVGKIYTDDILDEVFGRFCIGK